MNPTLKRILSACVLSVIFIFAFFSKHSYYFLIFVGLLSLLALFELSNLLFRDLKDKALMIFLTFISFFIVFKNQDYFIYSLYLSLIFWFFYVPTSLLSNNLRYKNIYVFFGYLMLVNLVVSIYFLFNNDRTMLLLTFLIIWSLDIFAFFSGKKFGKTKLAPNISPGKTFEGLYGAIFLGLVFIFILSQIFNYSFSLLFIIFLVITPLSVLGDLFESLIKRKAGCKDSGNILPGHGGILDRVDSLCPVLPIIAILYFYGIL